MPDDDEPDAPTTALRELFLIEHLTGVPVGPTPTYPVNLLDQSAVEETPAVIVARAARLQAVERELGDRLGLPPEALRERLPAMLKACEIDEDTLVSEWLLHSELAP